MASYTIPELTNEARLEFMADRIASLEAENAERSKENLQEVVTLADGAEAKQIEVIEKNKAQIEYLHLQRAKVQRAIEDDAAKNLTSFVDRNGDLKYRPPGFVDRPLYPTPDDGEKLMGRVEYERLSPVQKAQLHTISESDFDSLHLPDIFGRTSDAKKAVTLNRQNPSLYRAAKARAIERGIF